MHKKKAHMSKEHEKHHLTEKEEAKGGKDSHKGKKKIMPKKSLKSK